MSKQKSVNYLELVLTVLFVANTESISPGRISGTIGILCSPLKIISREGKQFDKIALLRP